MSLALVLVQLTQCILMAMMLKSKRFSCHALSNRFPACGNVKCLSVLLLLSNDITLNPSLADFGLLNSHSIRNKVPLISNIIDSNDLDKSV